MSVCLQCASKCPAEAPEETGPTPEELAAAEAERARLAEEARLNERVRFDFERDLPGFLELYDSDDAQLYELGEFEALDGRTLTRRELEEWQQRWADTLAAGEEAVAGMAESPVAFFEMHMRDRLSRHHYFRDRFREEEFERIDDYAPFALFVQKNEAEGAAWVEDVARRYGPAMSRLSDEWRRNYADPLELELKTHPRLRNGDAYALFVLRDRTQYDLYASEHENHARENQRAHYDPRYAIGVTYESGESRGAEETELHSALHEMVHAFQHAWFAAADAGGGGFPDAMPGRTWFNEGFAEYFSITVMHANAPDKALRSHVRAQRTLGMLVGSEDALASCVLPLSEMGKIRSYGDALDLMDRRAQANGLASLSLDVALQFLYRGAHTWMHYLHEGAGREGREAVLDYIRRIQGGEDPNASFDASFSPALLAELNDGYLSHLEDLGMTTSLVEKVRATF